MHPFEAAKEQNEIASKISELGNFVLLEKEIIKEKKS